MLCPVSLSSVILWKVLWAYSDPQVLWWLILKAPLHFTKSLTKHVFALCNTNTPAKFENLNNWFVAKNTLVNVPFYFTKRRKAPIFFQNTCIVELPWGHHQSASTFRGDQGLRSVHTHSFQPGTGRIWNNVRVYRWITHNPHSQNWVKKVNHA